MPRLGRGRTIVGGGVIAVALALSAFLGIGGAKMKRITWPAPKEAPVALTMGPALPEGELADDYELVDPADHPSAGLDGVVTSLSDLPIPVTKRTLRYVERFAIDEKGRKTFHDAFRRGGRYRDAIEHELADAGMPEDLVWLAAIESGFNPQAISPKGAAGAFQFMPETAERFGLMVTDEIDERRSVTKSASAASAYLKELYASYGAWDLALAAYNCGEGGLDEAIAKGLSMKGRKAGDAIAFHELAELKLLPSETANYVPEIHAFAIVAHNRELLDLEDLDPPAAYDFAEVAVPAGARLAPVAKAAGITLETLQEYNPDLLTDHLPVGHGDFVVNVPADALDQTIAALPALAARDKERTNEPAPTHKRVKPDAGHSSAAPVAEVAARGDRAKPSAPARPKLVPAPGEKGLFVLSNGVLVDLEPGDSDEVRVSASVEIDDPLRNRAKVGDAIAIPARHAKLAEQSDVLAKSASDLQRVLLGSATSTFLEAVTPERARFYEKTGFGPEFRTLADRMFPDGHPLHGATLVGPTEPADDMFLGLEPTWALKTTVTVAGPIDRDAIARRSRARLRGRVRPDEGAFARCAFACRASRRSARCAPRLGVTVDRRPRDRESARVPHGVSRSHRAVSPRMERRQVER